MLFDGSFYHLWYLPALLLGAPVAYLLSRLGQRKALLLAGGLYLIGLGGDSYYGFLPESVTGGEMIQTVSAEAEEAHNKVWTEFRAACGN